MLREFKIANEVQVENTGSRYVVNAYGDIKDVIANKQIKPDESGLVEITTSTQGIVKVKPELVVAMGFKPLYNSASFWFNWRILFEDGNSANLHPGNLIWQPPVGGQECPEQLGLYIVPGSSQFAVNAEGTRVYSRRLKRDVKLRKNIKKKNQVGFYMVYNGYTDTERMVTASVHRSVCLAFHEYGRDVNDITVNHKNGIKNDNSKNNLEWATYQQNNIHARDTGLCNTRKSVWLKDYKTGEVTRYESITAAGVAVGFGADRMYDKLYYRPNKLIKFRWYPSETDLGDEWPKYDWEELVRNTSLEDKRVAARACAAYNVQTGQTFVSVSPKELRKFINISKDQFKTAIESKSPWPSLDYIIWWQHSPKTIREFKKDELAAFKGRSGIRRPVRVTYKDGTTEVYVSLDEFCSRAKLNIHLVGFIIREAITAPSFNCDIAYIAP